MTAAHRTRPMPPARRAADGRTRSVSHWATDLYMREVEDHGVDACEHHEHHLDPEEDLRVIAQRLGKDQRRSSRGTESHERHLPREETSLDLRHGRLRVAPSKQSQVHHQDEAREHADGDDVNRQQNRIAVVRLTNRNARGHRVDPQEQAPDHGLKGPGIRVSSAAHGVWRRQGSHSRWAWSRRVVTVSHGFGRRQGTTASCFAKAAFAKAAPLEPRVPHCFTRAASARR